jgi:hypothetical protein
MLGSREYFKLLRVQPDSEYLRYFLDFYKADIQRFLPGFTHTPAPGQLTFFVLRDMVPAGLFIGETEPGGALRVVLDFVIPQFRDFKTGRYLFRDQAAFFRELGVTEILSEPGSPEHTAYLRRMGFAPGEGMYRLPVS